MGRPDELDRIIWKMRDDGLKNREIMKELNLTQSQVSYSVQLRRKMKYMEGVIERVKECRKNLNDL